MNPQNRCNTAPRLLYQVRTVHFYHTFFANLPCQQIACFITTFCGFVYKCRYWLKAVSYVINCDVIISYFYMSAIPASDPVCSHNGLVHIEGEVFWLSCNMTFQGAWAPVMTWYRGLGNDGDSEPLESVVTGTAADVTELNPRVDYSIKSTFARAMSRLYSAHFYRCVTMFPRPSAMPSADPHAALNDLVYQHTFKSERLVGHCEY